MDLEYQKRYNERAIENGEAFNMECFKYLDDHFSREVIESLHACLKEQPSKPIAFIAEQLQQLSRKNSSLEAKGVNSGSDHVSYAEKSANLCLCYPGGVCAELKPLACLSKPLKRVSQNISVAKLIAPTSYDITIAMQCMEVEAMMFQKKTRVPSANDSSNFTKAIVEGDGKSPAMIFPPLLLFVEPPALPSEVVFIKGIPYAHTLTDGLQYQHRRGNTAAPLPQAGQSFSEKAQELLKGSISPTDVCSLPEVLASILRPRSASSTVANSSGNTASKETLFAFSSSQWELIQLPSVQHNCFEVFNQIDNEFQKVAERCKDCLPTVLFVSYQEDRTSSLTFARILSTFFPYFERFQLDEMRHIRQETLARVKRFDLEFCLHYWDEAHRRREQRDRLRSIRPDLHGRRLVSTATPKSLSLRYNNIMKGEKQLSAAVKSPSIGTDLLGLSPETVDFSSNNIDFPSTEVLTRLTGRDLAQTIDSLTTTQRLSNTTRKATPNGRTISARKHLMHRATREEDSPELKEFQKRALEERKQRRRNEDSIYLLIVKAHQDALATRIQALFRGYRVRARLASSSPRTTKEKPRSFSLSKTFNTSQHFPEILPELIRLCFNRLQTLHGDVFGNYALSMPPQPKEVRIYVPFRRTILFTSAPRACVSSFAMDTDNEEAKEKDAKEEREEGLMEIESEAEEWKVETVLVPSQRHTQVRPHFNPLHRLLQYYKLAGAEVLSEATELMMQCTGMTMLQRQAYDKLKSVVLDLMHVAYTELYHRQKLSTLSDTCFSTYVQNYHEEVLAWFSYPHLVSLVSKQSNQAGVAESFESSNLFTVSSRSISRSVSQMPPVLVTEEGIQHERMLVCGRQGPDFDGGFPHKLEGGDAALKSGFKGESWAKLSPKVYWLAPTVPMSTFKQVLSHLIQLESLTPKKWDECSGDGRRERTPVPSEESIQTKTGILWCNLCAYPACYVDRDLFLLVPRQSKQQMEGRAAYDEYVMRRKVVHKQKWRAVAHDSAKEESVEDRTVCPNTTSCQIELPRQVVIPLELPQLSKCLNFSLLSEDEHLKKLLSKNTNGKGLILPHYIPASDEVGYSRVLRRIRRASPVRGSEGKVEFFEEPQKMLSVQSVKSAPSLRQQFYTFERRENEVGYDRQSLSLLMDDTSLRVKQSSPLRELTECSLAIFKREMSSSSGANSSFSSPIMPSNDVAEHCVQAIEGVVRTPQEVLEELAAPFEESSSSGSGGVSLRYLRPWMPPLPLGNIWLRRYEKLLDVLHERLIAGDFIVLCADLGDFQTIYVASALLLSAALGYEVWTGPEASDVGGNSAAARPTGVMKRPDPVLSFLNDFVEMLCCHFSKVGIALDNNIKLVDTVLQVLHMRCHASFTLDTIAEHIHAAEQQPSRDACKQLILSVVRDVEHYCWLILLAIFSDLSFSKSASLPFCRVPPTSFELFVRGIPNGISWIYSIDPWVHTPERSPDSSHLRYSNGMRRWDSEDYICFGVV